jgi:hypothetical protein
LQVIEQTSGGSDEQVDTLDQLLGLGAAVGSSNYDTERLRVVRHEFTCDTEDLEGEFAGGGDDNDTGSYIIQSVGRHKGTSRAHAYRFWA